MHRWKSRAWTILAFIAACGAIGLWTAARGPVPDLAASWPAPEAIDSLGAYAQPVGAISVVDDYAIHLPALESELPYAGDFGIGEETEIEEVEPGGWRVSAILISGGRPVAIVDDQQVRPGDRLGDGTLIESIGTDHVVVVDSRGRRQSLSIAPGE